LVLRYGFWGWRIYRFCLVLPQIFPDCHGNEIWDKMGYKSACVGDFCEIFAPIKGFRGWVIECFQLHFPPTDRCCHGNEIRDKMGYNLACVGDFCAYIRFSGMGHRMLPITFSSTDPRCHGNKIWNKIGYNSVCVSNFCEIFAFSPIGGSLGMSHRMLSTACFPDRPPLPWQRNLKQKLAITR